MTNVASSLIHGVKQTKINVIFFPTKYAIFTKARFMHNRGLYCMHGNLRSGYT